MGEKERREKERHDRERQETEREEKRMQETARLESESQENSRQGKAMQDDPHRGVADMSSPPTPRPPPPESGEEGSRVLLLPWVFPGGHSHPNLLLVLVAAPVCRRDPRREASCHDHPQPLVLRPVV